MNRRGFLKMAVQGAILLAVAPAKLLSTQPMAEPKQRIIPILPYAKRMDEPFKFKGYAGAHWWKGAMLENQQWMAVNELGETVSIVNQDMLAFNAQIAERMALTNEMITYGAITDYHRGVSRKGLIHEGKN